MSDEDDELYKEDEYMMDDNEEDFEEDDDIENRENFMQQEQDPQVVKLSDKIRLLRHKCVASMGNNLYDNAITFLKDAVMNDFNADYRRKGLVKILGEESIGFWAILDQILFFEDLVIEIKSLSTAVS